MGRWGSGGREVCVDMCDPSWTPLSLVGKDVGAKPGGEVQTGATIRSSQVSQHGSGSHHPTVKVRGE